MFSPTVLWYLVKHTLRQRLHVVLTHCAMQELREAGVTSGSKGFLIQEVHGIVLLFREQLRHNFVLKSVVHG